MRCYCLFGNMPYHIEKKKKTYEKCNTSKILRVVTVNLLTCSFPVELDADSKNQKFEKCFA